MVFAVSLKIYEPEIIGSKNIAANPINCWISNSGAIIVMLDIGM